jgi:hypothetical protein
MSMASPNSHRFSTKSTTRKVYRPSIEPLEDRLLLAMLQYTSTAALRSSTARIDSNPETPPFPAILDTAGGVFVGANDFVTSAFYTHARTQVYSLDSTFPVVPDGASKLDAVDVGFICEVDLGIPGGIYDYGIFSRSTSSVTTTVFIAPQPGDVVGTEVTFAFFIDLQYWDHAVITGGLEGGVQGEGSGMFRDIYKARIGDTLSLNFSATASTESLSGESFVGPVLFADYVGRALGRVWIGLLSPDLTSSLTWVTDENETLIKYNYEVLNNPITRTFNLTAAVDAPPPTIGIYWGDDRFRKIGDAIVSKTIPYGTLPGKSPDFFLPVSSLAKPPAGATRLLAIVDPWERIWEKSVGENNNISSLLLPDIVVDKPVWQESDAQEAVVTYGYQILAAPVMRETTFSIYWADQANTVLGEPIQSHSIAEGATRGGQFSLPASLLAQQPANAARLVAVADRGSLVPESNEQNNQNYLALQDVELDTLSWSAKEEGGIDIAYSINYVNLLASASMSFFWAESPDATSGDTATAPQKTKMTKGQHEIYVAGNDFNAPPTGKPYLIVICDAEGNIEEVDELNNKTEKKLEIVAPSIDILISPNNPEKNENFTIDAKVTNNGPVPLEFVMDWIGQYEPIPVYDDGRGAVTGTGPGESIVHGLLELGRRANGIRTDPVRVGSSVSIGLDGGNPLEGATAFSVDWKWINPKNPIDELANMEKLGKKSFSELVELLFKGTTAGFSALVSFLSALDDLFLKTTPVLAVHFDISIWPEASKASLVVSKETISVSVPQKYRDYHGLYVVDATAASVSMGLAAKAFLASLAPPAFVAAVAFIAAGNHLFTVARDEYENAKDPPDSNFKVLAEVESRTIPEINALPEGPLKAMARKVLELAAVTEAASISHNRADGAALAGDYLWQSRQLIAAATFCGQASTIRSSLANYLLQLHSVFPLSETELGTYLEANGLPESMKDMLTQRGWSETMIENLRNSLIESERQTPATRNLGVLTMSVASVLSNKLAYEYFIEASELRTKLNEPVRDLDTAEQESLAALGVGIRAQLAQGVPTAQLKTDLDVLFEKILRLMEKTNNPAALQEHLSTAFSFQFQFQQIDASLGGFQKFIIDEAGKGNIASDVAERLGLVLTTAEEKLRIADFNSVAEAFKLFLTLVTANQDNGITSQTAEKLKRFCGYIQSFTSPRTSPDEKATPTVDVTGGTFTFDGKPHAATGSVLGINDVVLGSPTFTYNGSSTPPTNAATYTVVASFAGNANYEPTSKSTTLVINKATPTVNVTGGTFTFDGKPHAATGSVLGINGAPLGSPTFTYNGSSTPPTNAATYTVVASFAGNANYNAVSKSTTLVINKVQPSLSNLSSPAIIYRTGTTMVTGKINAGVLVPPGNVTIGLNGVVQNVAIKNDGSFSVSLATGALATGSYNIAYSYSATANFLAASGMGKLMVSYKITSRFDQDKAKKAGSTLPVKLELTDAFATNVSSPSVPVTAMGIALASKPTVLLPAQDSGQANPNGLFRQQEKGYIFNLSTKGLAPGKYILFVKAGNDPIIQQITFLLS